MNKYVIYRRVSTASQGKDGLGMEAQQRDIDLYLSNYAGEYEVIGEFDEVMSGNKDNRPELNKALAFAKKHKAILLVAKLDRLSRKVSFVSSLMEDKDIEFKVACYPTATNFMLHIYAAMAEQEREFISVRTKAALQAAKARGKKLGGLRPNSHKMNQAKKEQATEGAEKLRNLIQPMTEKGMSTRAIAAALNDSGLRTATGKDYSSMQVSRLINRLGLQTKHKKVASSKP